ncbi:MAG: TlyA family RNA methyltransferase [Clostridia bacterium]|nr:TlyA family RNA methyltransferase [Clostridia bacterium]
MKKLPAWELLVEQGFCPDRKTAESRVLEGLVRSGGTRVDTPGQLLSPAAELTVVGFGRRFVGKGGLKLEGALDDFGMDIRGAVAIDAGASTGGFTDCLVQRGASRVYAVDVGFGQLAGSLRQNPHVVNMEKANIGDVAPGSLDPAPTLATVDLSYLSLRKAIPIFAGILGGRGEMLCLVKPLFETGDSEARRTGLLGGAGEYRLLLTELARFVADEGLLLTGVTHSHVTGNRGTHEFFLRIDCRPGQGAGIDAAAAIDKAVENVMKLDLYSK